MTILLLQGSRRTEGILATRHAIYDFIWPLGFSYSLIVFEATVATPVTLAATWESYRVRTMWGSPGNCGVLCVCVCARPLLGTVDICPCSGLTDLNLTAFLNPSYLYERFRTPR